MTGHETSAVQDTVSTTYQCLIEVRMYTSKCGTLQSWNKATRRDTFKIRCIIYQHFYKQAITGQLKNTYYCDTFSGLIAVKQLSEQRKRWLAHLIFSRPISFLNISAKLWNCIGWLQHILHGRYSTLSALLSCNWPCYWMYDTVKDSLTGDSTTTRQSQSPFN